MKMILQILLLYLLMGGLKNLKRNLINCRLTAFGHKKYIMIIVNNSSKSSIGGIHGTTYVNGKKIDGAQSISITDYVMWHYSPKEVWNKIKSYFKE